MKLNKRFEISFEKQPMKQPKKPKVAKVKPSTPDAVQHIANNMRPADHAEIAALTPLDPSIALIASCYNSEAYIGTGNGEPMCIFGCQADPQLRGTARIWMIGTPLIEQFQVQFLKDSKKWVKSFNDRFPVIYNFVDARNTKSIEWLKWLGFVFINEHRGYGRNGETFIEFVRVREPSPTDK